jgi:cobalt-zinc-cadmium resistance protein CzcA
VVIDKVNAIAREFGQRRAAIMVNLRGRDVESFVLEAQAKVNAAVKLPPGYSIEFGGQFKNLQEARARLTIIVPVALAVIFLLIFFAFGSLRQTLIVYSGIPLAVTGGVFALWARGPAVLHLRRHRLHRPLRRRGAQRRHDGELL